MLDTIKPNDDPYHHFAAISFGIHKGKAIETTHKKSLSLLDNSKFASQYECADDHWLVANIYHCGEFYIGKVPKLQVQDVLYTLEPFSGLFAHTMMRFRFKKPIKLIAKTPTLEQFKNHKPGETLHNPIELNDLILSVEATAPHGIEDFAFVASFFYTRGLAFRVLSLTGRGIKKYTSGEAQIKQYRLSLSESDANELFNTALIQGHNSGMKKMYQTLFANCNWFTFDMLQSSHKFIYPNQTIVGKCIGLLKLILNKVLIFSKIYPPLAILGLTWRNIRDSHSKPEINLETEPEFLRLAQSCQINSPRLYHFE